MPALYVSLRNGFNPDRYSLLNEITIGESLGAEARAHAKPTPQLHGHHGRRNGFMLTAMKIEHAASTIGHGIEHAVKPDPMAQLKADLKQAPTGEAKAKVLLSALKDVKDEKMSKEIISTGLETTKGPERFSMMAELVKGAPSPAMMKNQLAEIAISKPELTSLKDADLTKKKPEDFNLLPLRQMDLSGSKWPPNVKLEGNQDGLNLANVTAPGLDVRNATGTIKAVGANVKGGAINASANIEEAIKNAAKLGAAGATTDFRLASRSGHNLTLGQALQAGGIEGVKLAMTNGLAKTPKVNNNDRGMGMIQAPHMAV